MTDIKKKPDGDKEVKIEDILKEAPKETPKDEDRPTVFLYEGDDDDDFDDDDDEFCDFEHYGDLEAAEKELCEKKKRVCLAVMVSALIVGAIITLIGVLSSDLAES